MLNSYVSVMPMIFLVFLMNSYFIGGWITHVFYNNRITTYSALIVLTTFELFIIMLWFVVLSLKTI